MLFKHTVVTLAIVAIQVKAKIIRNLVINTGISFGGVFPHVQ